MTEETLFNLALEKPSPEERAAFLDQACADQPQLRAAVEALLQAHEAGGSFLNRPPVEEGPTGDVAPGRGIDPATAPPLTEGPGTGIGPYKLLEQIGEGGMGTVWMAEQQQPVRRKVALKIIKAGMDSAQVVARFEAERQALALMDHPHIAKVFDGGTTASGRPYFVMELVKGTPLTTYCDEHRLTPRQRLELFVPVCQALQHAHQKGIIHRDIKPSNVLVAPYDGKPVVKVIDFGVAKATGQRLTERTLFTGFGAVVGTLEYMSPEQAELNNQDIDTRSDVYSLGVLLYELLTGTTPLDRQRLKQAAFLELLRIIREEEPPKPSTRLGDSKDSLPSISAQRQMEPGKLTKLVRGELDWIVMKALEKDRGRRYETANSLARDVQRYLADEPVEACPPSVGYRVRKFLRRNKGPVLAAALVVLLLVGGIIGTTWGLVVAIQARDAEAIERTRAEKAEAAAKAERDKALEQKKRADEAVAIAQAVNDFLQKDLLGQANIWNQLGGVATGVPASASRGPDIKVRTLLDRVAKTLDSKFADQPLTEAAIRLTVGNTYTALGQAAEAQRHLERAVQLRTAQSGPDHPDTLTSKHHLALLYLLQKKYDRGESLLQEGLPTATAKLGADHPDVLTSKFFLATLYVGQEKKHDRAELLLREVLQTATAKLGADHPVTLLTKLQLATLYFFQKKYDRAESLLHEALQTDTAKLGADHPLTLAFKHLLAGLYQLQEKCNQAESLLRDLLMQNKHAEAEAVLRGCLVIREKKEPDAWTTFNTKSMLGDALLGQKKYADAEPLLLAGYEGMKKREAKIPADSKNRLTEALERLVRLYNGWGKKDKAAEWLKKLEGTKAAAKPPAKP